MWSLDFDGDRPHESPIFQCFPGVGLVAIPILASLGCFLPGGDPKTNSLSIHFSFAEMWYDASVAAGSGGRKDYKMARTARIKKSNNGTARYHLMSRTNDRRFLFEKGRVKTQLVDALKRAASFSGVELEAYVAMDNHFHIVCKVVRGGDKLPEGELIRRVAALKGERAAEDLASHWEELRGIGMDSAVAEAQDRLRARMNDVSEFIKTFKELFNAWYKREHGYSGSIWDGRFKSTLVEDGRYRAICMRT